MPTVINFQDSNSIYNTFLSELRDKNIQSDAMRFRRNLERLGEISALEISRYLHYSSKNIITPLGTAQMNLIDEPLVLATILRAGLPLHQGLLNYFDAAENCFISAYRKHTSEEEFDVEIEYMSSPDLTGKTVLLNDPMLASGRSMVLAYKALLKRGVPKKIHVVGVIASQEGVDFVKNHLPEDTTIWIGAIDKEMTKESYIVPGLGDAGDLAYGTKKDD
ncbi:MAG: uracil phosphoribosyltransferase [Bacteroidota bacterium]|nr:uracil phosphoribosyltransferase [Bacteroidota bacterium]MEC7083729.1 uracil phosphoribosyltransferase [Bacteroidota bacterium]MEC7945041.1 uracil phosphoribosyltransferase [Bacteroidota bacterium]MEC8030593.1 uracil phosphoribosyltransferase [Bacteroidota bacterium]MEC8286457.1 uracil phosphoribosyltransferase [Bacteroidota bacterium]|tara:strand:+ start:712 stop:1371 length:660 start_codon:yes stop_codon:yes gene_type:complete